MIYNTVSVHQATHELTCSCNWFATKEGQQSNFESTKYFKQLVRDNYLLIKRGRVCNCFTQEQIYAINEKLLADKKVKYTFSVKLVLGVYELTPIKLKVKK